MKKIAMFIVPHEDDMEILCFHAAYDLIQTDYHILEVVMTDGRYGLKNDKDGISPFAEFAGKRLKRIRKKELLCAAKAYGKNDAGEDHVEVIFMNYADGYLPFNTHSVKRIQNLIIEHSPSIVVGMDPFFALDHHHDHLNTGRNYFFALKNMEKKQRPKHIYFLQSYENDSFIPLGDFKLQEKVLNCHKSQLSPFEVKAMSHLLKYIYIIRAFILRRRVSSGLRRVSFSNETNLNKSILQKIKYIITYALTKTTPKDYDGLYQPLPKLGMGENELNPEHYSHMDASMIPEFYFGKKYS